MRGEGGTVGGGRFGFPLFALVSMTICHQSHQSVSQSVSQPVSENKDGKSEWSKFGEGEGRGERANEGDGMGRQNSWWLGW